MTTFRANGSRLGRPSAPPVLLAALAVAGLASFGCSDSSPPPRTAAVTPVDAATAARLTVRVLYSGTPLPPQQLDMSAIPQCAAAHPDPVFDPVFLVHDGRLANAVVYVEKGLGDRVFAVPTEPVVIDQKGCLYDPRVAAAMVGQPVEFHNADPFAHNVRGRPHAAKAWNFLMSRPDSTRTMSFQEAETGIRIGCDIHPWMIAYLSVFEHPYFAVTPADGTVALPPLPPGDYVVAAWHEALGTVRRSVGLPARGSISVDLAFDPAP
jgi:plastocyanin